MPLITVRERKKTKNGFVATVSFDHEGEFEAKIRIPFSDDEEQRLEWYYEEHLRFPFTQQVQAQAAAASIVKYGESLFGQVFADQEAHGQYLGFRKSGIGQVRFEIAGSPEFHTLHWESLKDPKLPQPFVLQSTMVRKNLKPQAVEAAVRPSPTINVLVVTARPDAAEYVGYRTISRPLVEAQRQAQVQLRIDILRPGTYEALVRHLEDRKSDGEGGGFYHVIHFDVHGGLLTFDQLEKGGETNRWLFKDPRYARGKIEAYEGERAFLFFEGPEEGQSDPAEAGELAQLLIGHQVPIAILNACQSGKQVGATETSLGSQLLQAGMQMVLAMGYSVTVSAAELLMTTLYEQLHAGEHLAEGIRRGRLELWNNKQRRAYFNQRVELEDWLLPVVYENRPQALAVRDFTTQERQAYYARQARQYKAPQTTYGFVGRDVDVLRTERRLLQRNLLLIRGMGGAGKTTLLHHLAAWWQATGFIDRVFYFGYDERAWNRQQIMETVARDLLSDDEYRTAFQPMGLDAQQAMLGERLRGQSHLLVLDNLESVTGAELALQNTLPEKERDEVRSLLSELVGGKTYVLLGSRGSEPWLAPGTFEDSVYDLPGLDPEAASTLAELILQRIKATKYQEDSDLHRLLRLLNGYPLALEVVLNNLPRQTPRQVLDGLEAGEVDLDSADAQEKTKSILKCIEYSHSNLSPEAQGLLSCLAPFTSVVCVATLDQYTEKLKKQPALAALPFDRWKEVLQEAANWGLLTPHPEAPAFVELQPIFPYFLRARLQSADQAPEREAVETAFREYYDVACVVYVQMLDSKEPERMRLGAVLASLEFENIYRALRLDLRNRVSFLAPATVLSRYFDLTHQEEAGLELCHTILEKRDQYSEEIISGQLGGEFLLVSATRAARYLKLKHYAKAHQTYEDSLTLLPKLGKVDERLRGEMTAETYHRLGTVAQEQRQWKQAEEYYQKALEIRIEFEDRYGQAGTFHNLGAMAQGRRQWQQAEECLQKALEIYVEFKDRRSQANTYHQLGGVAHDQRHWNRSEEYYKKALKIKIEFKDCYGQAGTYHQLGRVAQAKRQWQQAEMYYHRALTIYIEFKDRRLQACTYGQLGVLAHEQLQWKQAEEYYLKSLEINIEFNDRCPQAMIYHQLGRAAQERRQWRQAEDYYEKALEIDIEFKNSYEQAGSYHQLGMVAQEQRQWMQAEEYYLTALEIFAGANDEHSLGVTLLNITRLWRASGDANLPGRVGKVLGIPPEKAEETLRSALPDEGE